MWNRPEVDFLDAGALPWAPVTLGLVGGAHGEGQGKLLSRDVEVGAHTSLLRFRSRQYGQLANACDLLVLAGTGLSHDRRYRPGDFMHVPAGAVLDLAPSLGETVIYASFFGESTLQTVGDNGDVDAGFLLPVRDRTWTSMTWRGDRSNADGPGARIQWLRQDDDGIVFLVAMLPGWSSDQIETHPVYEESYKICGDLLMGSLGVVGSGGYFFRHPESPHGPLYTRDGSMSIIRKNGLGATDYFPAEGDLDRQRLVDAFYGTQSSFCDWKAL